VSTKAGTPAQPAPATGQGAPALRHVHTVMLCH
jgi:hypothetical protein